MGFVLDTDAQQPQEAARQPRRLDPVEGEHLGRPAKVPQFGSQCGAGFAWEQRPEGLQASCHTAAHSEERTTRSSQEQEHGHHNKHRRTKALEGADHLGDVGVAGGGEHVSVAHDEGPDVDEVRQAGGLLHQHPLRVGRPLGERGAPVWTRDGSTSDAQLQLMKVKKGMSVAAGWGPPAPAPALCRPPTWGTTSRGLDRR